MIADPQQSRVHNITGAGLESAAWAVFDRITPAPGSASTWKASSPIAGVTLMLNIKHEVTRAGRRRSTFRIDAKSPVGNAVITETPLEHSASAYIVVDRRDDDSANTKAMVDLCMSSLLCALVTDRAPSLADITVTAACLDFLNGEP